MQMLVSILKLVVAPVALVASLVGMIHLSRKLIVRGRGPRPTTYIWFVFPVFVLSVISGLVIFGFYDDSIWPLAGSCAAIVACATAILFRDEVQEALSDSEHPKLFRVLRDIPIVGIAALTAYVALEHPWTGEYFTRAPECILIGLGFLLVAIVALALIGQAHGVLAAPLVVAALLVGIAQMYVLRFRGSGITPLDLTVIGTAAEVAEGYSYVLGARQIIAMAHCVLGVTVLSFMLPEHIRRGGTPGVEPPSIPVRAVRFLLGAVCIVALALFVNFSDLHRRFDIYLPAWQNQEAFANQGFIPTFIAGYQDMDVPEPEGYGKEEAEKLERELAAEFDASDLAKNEATRVQFGKEHPNVVVVMNESFADMSDLLGEGSGYSGPEFFNGGIEGLLARGNIFASVCGGGTCNTEFEMFTGNATAFMGGEKYPFVMYNLSKVESMVRTFGELGYATTALHPANPNNYNRSIAYPALGFDTFIAGVEPFVGDPSASDPEHKVTFHGEVRDRATYAKVLEILKEGEGPQFVFDLTMQNHGPYTRDIIAEDMLTTFEFEGLDGESARVLNDYLSCIAVSDADLEEFLGELEKLDEKTVVLFFGDHQPGILGSALDVYASGETQLDRWYRAGKASYLMWANYKLDGFDYGSIHDGDALSDIGANALGIEFMHLIGAPLTEYQKAVLETRRALPAVSMFGYTDTTGAWYGEERTPTSAEGRAAADARTDLEIIQYGNLSPHL